MHERMDWWKEVEKILQTCLSKYQFWSYKSRGKTMASAIIHDHSNKMLKWGFLLMVCLKCQCHNQFCHLTEKEHFCVIGVHCNKLLILNIWDTDLRLVKNEWKFKNIHKDMFVHFLRCTKLEKHEDTVRTHSCSVGLVSLV